MSTPISTLEPTSDTDTPALPPNRLLYSVEEAASTLCLSRTAVFRLLKEGELRSVKIHKRRLISAAALADFVASLEERAN